MNKILSQLRCGFQKGPLGGKTPLFNGLFQYISTEFLAGFSSEQAHTIRTYLQEPLSIINGKSPLFYITQLIEQIEVSDDLESETISHYRYELGRVLIQLLMDQHVNDQAKYVAHNCNHGFSVAEKSLNIVSCDAHILDSLMVTYSISKDQSLAMVTLLGLIHDIGYPEQQRLSLCKTNHSECGARLFSTQVLPIMERLMPHQRALLMDFRDAILGHNADKKTAEFDLKFETKYEGVLLANVADLETIMDHYGSQIIWVEASNSAVFQVIENRSKGSFPLKLSQHGTAYVGRGCDISESQTGLGLEYHATDLIWQPLQALIRLADNMDIGRYRLSPIQRHPVFRDTYMTLCGRGELKHLSEFAEACQEDDLLIRGITHNDDFLGRLEPYCTTETERFIFQRISRHLVSTGWSFERAKYAIRDCTVEHFFERHNLKDPHMRDIIREAVNFNFTFGYRYYIGCLSILGTDYVASPPHVVIQVDTPLYRTLNQKSVMEKEERIPLGQYNIWRTAQALCHIPHKGKQIALKIESSCVESEKKERRVVTADEKRLSLETGMCMPGR